MTSDPRPNKAKMIDAYFLKKEFGISERAIGELLADEVTSADAITEQLFRDGAPDPLRDVPVPQSGPHSPDHDEHMLKPVVHTKTDYNGGG